MGLGLGFGMGLGFGLSIWFDSFGYSFISVICQEAGYFLLIHRSPVIIHRAEFIHFRCPMPQVPLMLIAARELISGAVDVDVDVDSHRRVDWRLRLSVER